MIELLADRTSLGFLGFVFGGVTVAVAAIAFLVVTNNVNANAGYDDMALAQFVPASAR